jgi:hypothetical protein
MEATMANRPVQASVDTAPAQARPASAVMAAGRPQVGKTRNPWGVFLLSWITLGIYGLYWYYKVNEEARDYDSDIKVDPIVSLLAITIGSLVIIPAIVSYVNTAGRIARAQQKAGSSHRCSGWGVLLFSFAPVYYQSQLNKTWDMHGNPPAGTPIA